MWLDRDGAVRFPDEGPRPDAVVAGLTELPEVLRRLDALRGADTAPDL